MLELPWHLKIQGIELSLTVIGIVLFCLVYVFVFWNLGQSKNRSYDSFDTSVFALFSSLLGARIIAVIGNWESYLKDPAMILNFFDKKFLYAGVFLGLLLATYLTFRWSNKEKVFYPFLEKVIVSYSMAIVPLLAAALVAGKMLGIVVQGNLAIPYDGGISRMPLNIFRIIYNLLFLAIWTVAGRQSKQKGLFGLVYILLYGGIEFMLRFFSNGYKPVVGDFADISQITTLIVVVVGILLFLNYYNFKIFNLQSKPEGFEEQTRRRLNDPQGIRPLFNNTPKERFSLSYSSIQDSVKDNELNLQEKIRIWWNTFKRKFKK